MSGRKLSRPRPRNAVKPKPPPKPPALAMPRGVRLFPGEPLMAMGAVSFLPEGTRVRLLAFCDAHHGADPEKLIDKAVNKFMADDLRANSGVAAEYKGE